VPWFASVPCMVFCTPIIAAPLDFNNQTSSTLNVTLAGDEVGKIELIKFRDGSQCTIDDDDDEHMIKTYGICIAGQCQVKPSFVSQTKTITMLSIIETWM